MHHGTNIKKFAGFAAAAALINSIIFLVAKSADATLIVNQNGAQEIALPMVIASSFFGLVVAAFIASKISAKSQSFATKSPVIGLVFGVVTAIAPFTASDDSKTALALASMHIVAGVTWFVGVNKSK